MRRSKAARVASGWHGAREVPLLDRHGVKRVFESGAAAATDTIGVSVDSKNAAQVAVMAFRSGNPPFVNASILSRAALTRLQSAW